MARRGNWDEAGALFSFTSPVAVPYIMELFRAHGKHFDREAIYFALARISGRPAAEGLLEVFPSFPRDASLREHFVWLLEHAAKQVGDRNLAERVRRAVAGASWRPEF